MTLKQAAALADMSQNNLIKLIRLGENGDEKYIELYDVYQNKYIPTQLETFLDKIKSSKYKKALKSAHLTEDELNKYYILGLEGNEPFKEFTDKYFEFKLENYKKEIIQKGKTESRAARNANFIDKDFELRQKEIDCALVENQLEIITPMVEEGYHAKYIAGKINIDVDVFFDWYVKGYNGDETFKEFAETYWDCRMQESVDDFQSLFDKGISEKFFLKYIIRKNVLPEYKFWKSLGLFEFKNQLLSEEEQFNIIKENVLDVKDNVMKILEAADEDTDLEVPVEELIGEIEDADLKRHVKNFLKKEDDEDG
ncbi:MAG: hypothetical protein IKH85_07505 [Methanobrevibacter sp.]|uniref:hypothetical protein n=1 Tax=Methanobrevibacter sp. TaxID=66852 RepID=UPI0025F99B90|nr:hypothetical protein [Methanobrevibacter sp.]MBR6993904.1 hypothetical protein [Methanobrevibacter sp.]